MSDVTVGFLRGPDLDAVREAVERANARGEDEAPVLLPSTGQLVVLHRSFPADAGDSIIGNPYPELHDEGVPS